MEPRHARYPFLETAREAVREADADLAAVIADGGPLVDRARERVANAVDSDTVGDPVRSTRTELFSYPVARVLVSLLDEPGLTRRYARAEAQTALQRLATEPNADSGLRSVQVEPLSIDALLEDLGLAGAFESTADGFRVAVGPYLELTDGLSGDQWRLVNRALVDGSVPITDAERDALLREGIRQKIEADLPLDVPDEIAAALEAPLATLRDSLADHRPATSFDTVDPALFPPCIDALFDRVEAGTELAPHSRFSLLAFLAAVGMTGDEIVDRLTVHPAMDEPTLRATLDHLREADGSIYPPPSCRTMDDYGDCVNQDALCDRIAHPLDYYDERLDGADPAQLSRVESQ